MVHVNIMAASNMSATWLVLEEFGLFKGNERNDTTELLVPVYNSQKQIGCT
jgi:hypothetical protein